MAWRLAKSLEKLRTQINSAYPKRSKISDGTIGDAAHANTVSDHNPNSKGVVTAFDLTHDPKNGVDIVKIAEKIRTDPRVKYLIRNRQILITANGQRWVKYNGINPHTSHLHISVGKDYDSTKAWDIEEEDMISNTIYNILEKFYFGDSLSKRESDRLRKKYIGKYSPEEVKKNFENSKTYAKIVTAAKAGKLDIVSHAPEKVRKVYKQPALPNVNKLKKGIYEVE